MAGKIGRSGRKKSLSTIMRQVMENDAYNLPLYFQKVSDLALKGDRESLLYLIDRHLGKPKATMELEGEMLGAGTIMQIFKLVKERQLLEAQKQIKERQKQLTEGVTEGVIEGGKDATEQSEG